MLALLHTLADGYTYNYGPGTSTNTNAGSSAWILIFYGILLILTVIALWKVFQKAGKPGWAGIVPFYGQWVLAEAASKPGWWGLLLWVPIVNIVAGILVGLGLARNFGKSSLFGVVGLWLFSTVGLLILGFGPAEYRPVAVDGKHTK